MSDLWTALTLGSILLMSWGITLPAIIWLVIR